MDARCDNFDDPGRWWIRTAEPQIIVPASSPLDHEVLVERALLELPDELQGEGSVTKYFVFADCWYRTTDYKVSQSTTLSTQPRPSHRCHHFVTYC